jgi:dipeptidyl aminopeptidase/acylaminoacyl peptidase
MKRYVCLKLLCLLCLVPVVLLAYVAAQELAADQVKRPVTIADAIRMTRLGNRYYWRGGSSSGLVAQFSPDGKRFVVVLRKGNLERNTNEYSMLLWRTDEVFRSPPPEVLVQLSSSSNRPAIYNVIWMPDNETVTFIGENPDQQGQVYAVNIRTRELRAVAKNPHSVLAYSVAPTGHQVAYLAEPPVESLFNEKAGPQAIEVPTTQNLYKLLIGQRGRDAWESALLFFQSETGDAREIHTNNPINYNNETNQLHLSPDGKYIVILSYVTEFPKRWTEYTEPDLHRAITQWRPPGQHTWVARYDLIDTGTGESRPLLDVPVSTWDTELAWSPDSRSVVIVNTYLPLSNVESEELQGRKTNKFTVVVDIPRGNIASIFEQKDLKFLAWDTGSDQLTFEIGRQNDRFEPRPKVLYRKVGEKWQIVTGTEDSQPEILLKEDMQSPPRIFAVDPKTQHATLLLDLNPQFKDLKLGKVEEIRWKSADGVVGRGGLYYPTSYVPGKRYPLVIQTHGWNAERFYIDGPFTTAFAGQALAGKGIVVLQVEEFEDDKAFSSVGSTPRELERVVSIYEGAIEYLVHRRIVDRKHVGILGFSRSCMWVKYALSHSKYHFAAASVTDGIDAGYFQYIAYGNANSEMASEYEGIYGGPPFGQGLRRWIERAPGFNISKVQSPVLITALNRLSALFEWEWFSASIRLGKPVDMVMLEDGVHLLEKPWERVISQQGSVDWFCFWLKGEEDPDPAKAEQYVRWRGLQEVQEEKEKHLHF